MNRLPVWTSAVALTAFVFLIAEMATAQTTESRTATITATAPVFASPNASQQPLRVAREGSVLILIDTNPEWTQVEFQDPEFGRRVGYVQTKNVRISGAASRVSEPASPQLPRPAPAVPRPPTALPQARVGQQRGDVSFGYVMMRDEEGMLPFGLSGGSANAVTRSVDVVLEAQYARGTLDLLVGETDGNIWTVLGGPRFWTGSRDANGPRPFVQVLGGVLTAKVYFGALATKSASTLAVQPGIGVDLPVNRSVAIRPQADWLLCRIDGVNASEIRLNANVVVRLFHRQ